MFVIEAVPALLLGFAVLAYLTGRPEKAAWLPSQSRCSTGSHAAFSGRPVR
jgi:ACS family tartrate transporter-like MFS transporter